MRGLDAPNSVAGKFARPKEGASFAARCPVTGATLSGGIGWRSNGGIEKKNPYRALPSSLEIGIPHGPLQVQRVIIHGVLADCISDDSEPIGCVGATISLQESGQTVWHFELRFGRHYFDACQPLEGKLMNGDGATIEPIGWAHTEQGLRRVDRLTLELPSPISADSVRFQDAGTPASFIIFDCLIEFHMPVGCPFHSSGGGIALSELPAIIRLGDRIRWERATQQLIEALARAGDLDEARSQALTFIAVLTASALERGADKSLHRTQLETARKLDSVESLPEIVEIATEVISDIAEPMFGDVASPSAHLVRRAIAFVERNFARDLDEGDIADHLGLSTSHFRYLFRQDTGQPFHRFLIGMRLEKARKLLAEGSVTVSQAAQAVGFQNPSHFSRAFSKRFGASPVEVRRQVSGVNPVDWPAANSGAEARTPPSIA